MIVCSACTHSPCNLCNANAPASVSIAVIFCAVPVQAQDVQQWLRRACAAAVDGPLARAAGDYACARQQAFPAEEGKNAYRHLRIADYSDAVAALPPEELQVRLCSHSATARTPSCQSPCR